MAGKIFDLGRDVLTSHRVEPFDRREACEPLHTDPPVRRITVFTQDPATPRMDVSTAEIELPFQSLEPGPAGSVMKVIDRNETGQTYEPADLDALGPGYPSGYRPSVANPRFAQQMVYGVAMKTYETFRQALGRTPQFAFDSHTEDDKGLRLHLFPHFMEEANAFYDPSQGALLFGYTYSGHAVSGLNQPGGVVFTSLSHDVVVHETTHALLDGMRSRFLIPSNPDVLAFHEGFADLVALFLRFTYRDLVRRAIDETNGSLSSRLLTDLARQFGNAVGNGNRPLRSAILAAGELDDPVEREHQYDSEKGSHDLGAVLVAAVFDAFRWIFAQKTASLRNLARLSSATTVSAELKDLLVDEAQRLAKQFLNILIRAVDYCPPVDITFGEFLRALVTADYDTVPDDPWGYRETFARAFRRYGITIEDVFSLCEDSLLWQSPPRWLPPIEGLGFCDLRHGWEPGASAPQAEYERRARQLGEFVCSDNHRRIFGLAKPRRGNKDGAGEVTLPKIESVRTLRRISPSGHVNFDLIAEVLQQRRLAGGLWLEGGATIIVDSRGRVRYSILKNVESRKREVALKDSTPYLGGVIRSALTGKTNRTQLLRELHEMAPMSR